MTKGEERLRKIRKGRLSDCLVVKEEERLSEEFLTRAEGRNILVGSILSQDGDDWGLIMRVKNEEGGIRNQKKAP